MQIQTNVKPEARPQGSQRPKRFEILNFFGARRRLQEIEGDLRRLKSRIEGRDAVMDDRQGDGLNARPPEGDDYNELYEDVTDTLHRLSI